MTLMKFAMRTVMLWVGVSLVLFGAVFLGVHFVAVHQEERFAHDGRTVDGIVITKDIERARRGTGSSRRSTEYRVTYRFTPPEGAAVDGRGSVSSGLWDSLQERGPVRVEYIVSDPSTNRVAGQSSPVLAYVFAAIGIPSALAGIVLTVVAMRRAGRKARVWSDGMPTDATVLGVEESSVTVNNRPMWVVRYQYLDHAGQMHEAVSEYMSAARAQAWKPGDKSPIRFDPQRPADSVWVGKS